MVFAGYNIVWQGGGCSGAFKATVNGREIAVCVVDGYLITLELETGEKTEANLLIQPCKLPDFIKGAEVFYRSISGLSGSVKVLLDPLVEVQPISFDSLYSSAFDRIIFGSPDQLLLLDRKSRQLVWFAKVWQEVKQLVPPTCRVIVNVGQDSDVVLRVRKAHLVRIPPLVRFVEDVSHYPGIPVAVEIKPNFWQDRCGLYFYAQSDEEAMEKEREILLGGAFAKTK